VLARELVAAVAVVAAVVGVAIAGVAIVPAIVGAGVAGIATVIPAAAATVVTAGKGQSREHEREEKHETTQSRHEGTSESFILTHA
jgi:hypothetical protein